MSPNSFIYILGETLVILLHVPISTRTLELHITMALAHHPTPVLPIWDLWCVCLHLPYPNPSQHSSQPSSLTLHLKLPLSSSRTTIPFHFLSFPNKPLKQLGYHSLILSKIHLLCFGFPPLFWDIGDLLCIVIVYHLSHHYTITMCHCLAFLF